MTPREAAQRAARIAAYHSADAHTPADYTPREALDMMAKQDGMVAPKKRRRYEKVVIVQDEATSPIFGEVGE